MTRDEILTSLRERILAFATSRVSREVAEDLTQEVLVLLHEKYARVTELTELVPLAFQVLRFKMLDAHRKSLRRGEYNQESVDELPLANPGDDPGDTIGSEAACRSTVSRRGSARGSLPRPPHIEIGRTQFPGDSNAHGTAFDQHHLHLGSPLPKTVVEFDGRHVGMMMSALISRLTFHVLRSNRHA
jgi:hypothetical protein